MVEVVVGVVTSFCCWNCVRRVIRDVWEYEDWPKLRLFPLLYKRVEILVELSSLWVLWKPRRLVSGIRFLRKKSTKFGGIDGRS
jgi:hypothetical protein